MAEEIIIKIKRRRRHRKTTAPSIVQSSPSGALIRPRSGTEYQARRVSQGDRVNFYDAAYLKNPASGLFETIDWQAIHPFAFADSHLITHADFQRLYDIVFGVPFNNWKSRFYRWEHLKATRYDYRVAHLSDGSPVETPINEGNENWSPKGLRLTDEQIESSVFAIAQNPAVNPAPTGKGANYDLYLKGATSKNLITRTFNPDAPDVEIDLSGGLDVYLMPRPMLAQGRTFIQWDNSAGHPGAYEARAIDYFYTIFPRRVLFEENDPSFGADLWQQRYYPLAGDDSDQFQKFSTLVNFLRSLPNARGFLAYGFGVNPTPAADFPGVRFVYPPGNTSDMAQATADVSLIGQTGTSDPGQPELNAVIIRNGGEKYYVWSKFV